MTNNVSLYIQGQGKEIQPQKQVYGNEEITWFVTIENTRKGYTTRYVIN